MNVIVVESVEERAHILCSEEHAHYKMLYVWPAPQTHPCVRCKTSAAVGRMNIKARGMQYGMGVCRACFDAARY